MGIVTKCMVRAGSRKDNAMTHLILLYPGVEKATYHDLRWRIDCFHSAVQIEKNCWAVNTTKSPDALAADLSDYIDTDIDKLLVCEVKSCNLLNFSESITEALNG